MLITFQNQINELKSNSFKMFKILTIFNRLLVNDLYIINL